MNKLNTFLSFVLLSFCLLINVSYAEIPANVEVAIDTNFGFVNASTFGDYSASTLLSYFSDYYNKDDETSFDTLLSIFSDAGFSRYVISRKTDGNNSYIYLYFLCDGNDVAYNLDDNGIPQNACYSCDGDTLYYQFYIKGSTKTFGYVSSSKNKYRFFNLVSSSPTMSYEYDFSSEPIKIVTLRITDTSQYYITWDGTSYYQVSNPSTSTMPTNAEIASAVQLFYNSVYQATNAFDDFFVLYDTSTKLYTYVGHTRGNSLGQVIVEPNGYFEGYKFDVQWWKFFLDEQEDSWNWQNISKYFNYYVYSSEGTADTFKEVGYSNISGLLSDGPWATSTTIIVYSTTDYPVKYITFSDDSPEPNIQTGVIEGDQYTYDENLDITDNNYNPLDSFVTIDYPSSLVSRADFEEFMNIFNENSQFAVLPSNANWIVIANNSLFEHFSSFIIIF